jgi:hypothetical protein
MKKPAALALCTLALSSVFAEQIPAAPSPEQSWMIQAGVFYRANKLCDKPALPEDARILGDILLASTVNPDFTGQEKSDKELFALMLTPTARTVAQVELDKSLYLRVVSLVQARHDIEHSLCTAETPKQITAFAEASRKAGVAGFAKRIVKIMVENKCQGLYCKPL